MKIFVFIMLCLFSLSVLINMNKIDKINNGIEIETPGKSTYALSIVIDAGFICWALWLLNT